MTIRANNGAVRRLMGWTLAIAGVFMAVVIVLLPHRAAAACAALPTTKGVVSGTVTISSTGSYRVWVREQATASAAASSLYLQLADAGACQVVVGGAALPVGQLVWVNYQNGNPATPIEVTIGSGSHTVQLAGRDDGVEVDKVLFLSDKSCVPAGDGANCQQTTGTSTPVTTGSSSSGSKKSSSGSSVALPPAGQSAAPVTVSGNINLTPDVLPANVKKIQYYLDGKEIPSGKIDTTKLSDGPHTLETKTTYTDGRVTVSKRIINVKNKKTWQEQLGAWLVQAQPFLIGFAIILTAAVAFWLLNRRYGWINLPGGGGAGGVPGASGPHESVAAKSPVHPTAPIPIISGDGSPPAKVVYPVGWDKSKQ